MKTLELDNLILKDKDYIVSGNLKISKRLAINNCRLIVSGTLSISSEYVEIAVLDSDISVGELQISDNLYQVTFIAVDSDIFVAGNFSLAIPIYSDGNINVGGYLLSTEDISCKNLLVNSFIIAKSIEVTQGIYSLSHCDCNRIIAQNIFSKGYLNLNGHNFYCSGSYYVAGGILNCPSLLPEI